MGGPKDSRSLGMTLGHPGPEYQSSSTPLNGRMSVSQARRNSSMRSGSIRNVHRVDSFLSVAGSSWSGTEFYDAQEEVRAHIGSLHCPFVVFKCKVSSTIFEISGTCELKGFGENLLPSFFLT